MFPKLIADLHTHTLASTHAYSTLQEMVQAASAMGLYAIAITDHGRTMPGSPGKWYFENMGIIPSHWMGVRVIKGIEANITDYYGTLDVDEFTTSSLEWVIASIHRETLPWRDDIDAVTNTYIQVAKNPLVNVIGHSGHEAYKYDYEKVIPIFGDYGKLVEINEATFNVRKESVANCAKIAELCKKHGVGVVVNSDAHFQMLVGKAPRALQMLEEIGFPHELIINADARKLLNYVAQHNIEI